MSWKSINLSSVQNILFFSVDELFRHVSFHLIHLVSSASSGSEARRDPYYPIFKLRYEDCPELVLENRIGTGQSNRNSEEINCKE